MVLNVAVTATMTRKSRIKFTEQLKKSLYTLFVYRLALFLYTENLKLCPYNINYNYNITINKCSSLYFFS